MTGIGDSTCPATRVVGGSEEQERPGLAAACYGWPGGVGLEEAAVGPGERSLEPLCQDAELKQLLGQRLAPDGTTTARWQDLQNGTA